MNTARDPLLVLKNLTVKYPARKNRAAVEAVKNVSLFINPGEIVGLVGESGCGKTSLGCAVMGITTPAQGYVIFEGRPINTRDRHLMQQHRRQVQMVFQDPMGALNPRLTVEGTLIETLFVHRHAIDLDRPEMRQARCAELMEQVGLDPSHFGRRYPHELSGGQRQRVGIARALAVQPRLLVADEPVSALDVSIQVQILNLLKDVCEHLSVACLFIAHDLAVVRYMCRRTYVMVHGEIVEQGESDCIFDSPQHPYTRSLIDSVPDVAKGLAARQ